MSHTTRRHRAALGAIALVAVAGTASAFAASSATAAPASPAAKAPSPVVVHTAPSVDAAKVTAYWTPARMKAAKPVDLTVAKSPAGKTGLAPRADGAPGSVAGSGSAAATKTASPEAAYQLVKVPVAKTKKWPNNLNGKIFFTNLGVDYVCSGTSVAAASAPTQNQVWTAGHCVANTEGGNQFDSYAQFIPAYNGNASTESKIAPFGRFTATQYITTTAWLNNYDFSVDMGSMRVGTNAKGQTLGQAVGWGGFAWNQSYTQTFNAFGYPAGAPFNGTAMYRNKAATSATYTFPGGAGATTLGIPNPMTGGSSGGSWNIGWNGSAGQAGRINGHNDFKFNADPSTMYSPYFNNLANTVRCFGATSC